MLGGLVNRNLDPVFRIRKQKKILPTRIPGKTVKFPPYIVPEKSGVNHILIHVPINIKYCIL